MNNSNDDSKANALSRSVCKMSILAGNSLTLIGSLGLLLAFGGFLSVEDFAIGISSGIRVIGTVAIAGCLLSAIGYGFLDYIEDQ